MSIRIRTVNGTRVALCGYETDPMPGDVYLDDGDHYALAAKFAQDFSYAQVPPGSLPEYAGEWAAMETQKRRDARTRTDL